jgi:hypothetical protein
MADLSHPSKSHFRDCPTAFHFLHDSMGVVGFENPRAALSDFPKSKLRQTRRNPRSLEVICDSCFDSCESLTSVTFDANSRLSRLENEAFCGSRLQSIHIPGSLEVICESCFYSSDSLTSVTFDANSQLSRLEKQVFSLSGLHLMRILQYRKKTLQTEIGLAAVEFVP